MDLENEVVRDTASLHSDMQTLVYENYNKFISATETVRKVSSKVNFFYYLKFSLFFNCIVDEI